MNKVKTNLKPRDYTTNEVVRIVNTKQNKLYVKNGIYPIDMYTSIDENDNDVLVMIYLKKDTADVYKKWCKYELE